MIHYGTLHTTGATVLTMPRHPDYMGPTEAAEFLGVSRSTFYRLWDAGDFAAVRIYRPSPRRPLFHRADLEAWKKARESLGGADPAQGIGEE